MAYIPYKKVLHGIYFSISLITSGSVHVSSVPIPSSFILAHFL